MEQLVPHQQRQAAPSEKLLEWARQHDLDADAAGAREPCLYLIPDYETEDEAEEILKDVYEVIFEAELDHWHRDSGTVPEERTYSILRKWFDVLLYRMIQDLRGSLSGSPWATRGSSLGCTAERHLTVSSAIVYEGLRPLGRVENLCRGKKFFQASPGSTSTTGD
jgi:hypothetical protein